MFDLTEVMTHTCIERLQSGYREIYGNFKPEYPEIVGWVANVVLEEIAHSDALYHDVEHTILVTLVGQEILRGKQIREGNVSGDDWLHFIVSLLCHDIGYVKGVCRKDECDRRLYIIGFDDMAISLPLGATDASLTPFHVNRSQIFAEEKFAGDGFINSDIVKQNIELTRFPVPADEAHKDTINYPGLTRAADLIGQLSDPRYLQKIPALFCEFEETGMNKNLGYQNPGDLRYGYPNFFWNVAFPYIQYALRYLETTLYGKEIIANLYSNVFQVEEELEVMGNIMANSQVRADLSSKY